VGRPVPSLLLFLVLSAAAPVQAQTAGAVREAEALVTHAQQALRASYEARRQPSRAIPPRTTCDETTGDDCFGGDVECARANACAWPPARAEMTRLGRLYDSTAVAVQAAASAMDRELLRWLEGQRVGTWARLGELDHALGASDDCTSYDWWCAALRGFVQHRQGRYVEAERAFRAALRTMPPGRACYWNELTLYFDTAALSVQHGGTAACRTLEELEPFWILADPLFSVPGNDRLTEHYARHVDMTIHEDFLAVFGGRHPAPHHSEILRFGWPTGFRVLPRLHDAALRTELVHGGGSGFIVLADPADALRAPAADHAPRPDDPRERYRPVYGPVQPVPAQYGFFRRAGVDVLLIRARAAAPAAAADWKLLSWDGAQWRSGTVHAADTISAWIETPWQPQLFSLEAVHDGGAWRARSGTRPPTSTGSAALSSVVLLDGASGAPSSSDEVAGRMLPGTAIAAGADVAAYWVVYLERAYNAHVELTTTRLQRPGLLARLLRRAPPQQRTVRWQEELRPAADGVRRSVTLDLAGLASGDYDLELQLLLDDGTALHTATLFSVR
jgi:hypothetical protein